MRLRCQTILARQRIASRGASLAGARRVLRPYRPRVLLLDAARSPRRALGGLPTLKRLSLTWAQTLLREWAYRRPYASSAARILALPVWLHYYN